MSYRILSLYYGHDANICLLEDGNPVLVLEKERYSRIKHDQGHMNDIIPTILKEHGWTPESIDMVVINPYCRPTLDGSEFYWDLEEDKTFVNNPEYLTPVWQGTPEERYSRHKIRLSSKTYDCIAVDHHLAHIAGAFFTSTFTDAGILTSDGGGDERFSAMGYGLDNKIEWIEYDWGKDRTTDYSMLNIGSTWASIGEYNFGYQRLEGAGKLMGLSSYAEAPPLLIQHIQRHAHYYWPFPFPTNLFYQPNILDPHSQFAKELAAALQEYTRLMYLAASKRIKNLKNVDRLCMTGGCAMNCLVNTAIHTSGIFKDTYVPAQPHDGGLSLGQALFAWHHVLENPRKLETWSPYLGTDIPGEAPLKYVDEIVQALLDQKTVGLAFGRAESGPRSLGHRSIIADPRRPDIKDHINQNVKQREWFRPYAPVVLKDDYSEWFVDDVPSTYMGYMAGVKEDKQDIIPGIVHVDGTARPQVLGPEGDPVYRAILERWKEATGVPVLLNTSFNHQEPLVNTEQQAENTWKNTGLDVLVTHSGIKYKNNVSKISRREKYQSITLPLQNSKVGEI